MVCIYCSKGTKVTNSRHQKRSNHVWRRRTCLSCGAVFTSLEAVDLRGSIQVEGQEGLEPFQRDKLFMSIFDSLKHRKTAVSDATALTDTILGKLQHSMQKVSIKKPEIAKISLDVLLKFDRVAATHYQAFHPLA